MTGCDEPDGVPKQNGQSGSSTKTICCVFLHGDCAGKCYAKLQRRTWRARRRHHPRSGGHSVADGCCIATLPEGLLPPAFVRRRGPNGRTGRMGCRKVSGGRGTSRLCDIGGPARRTARLALRGERRAWL